MITFITSYDDATSDNYNLYKSLNLTYSKELTAGFATKINLGLELDVEPKHIFAMSHGDHSILYDNNKDNAFDDDTLSKLPSHTVFAYACNTANKLGFEAATAGVYWCGFKEPINSPCSDEVLKQIYTDLFEFIAKEFVNVNCSQSALQYLDSLKTLCDLKSHDLDACTIDGYETPIAAYQSVKQLWEKQKVWLVNQNSPIVHPNAPAELLW